VRGGIETPRSVTMEHYESDFIKHLTSRCANTEPSLYGTVDKDNELFTRMIYNLSKLPIGYQQYNWRGGKKSKVKSEARYYTYVSANCPQASNVFMGMDMLRWGEPLFLVEGSFEQIHASTRFGLNCMAVLCNSPKHLKPWLFAYPNKIIGLCQPGEAGVKLANVCDFSVQLTSDLDEYTDDEWSAMCETNLLLKG
jgi:hypothetical protein